MGDDLAVGGARPGRIRDVDCALRLWHAPLGDRTITARRLVGEVKTLNLDLDDDVLRDRLRRRPGYDGDRVERKVRMAASLRAAAEVNIDTTQLGLDQVSSLVEEWLLSSRSASERP
jgi:hypothetical protein